jgi:cytochrome c oxidase assembly protein subunit 15
MYKKLLELSIILALIVVILGAYTRLADAGLGCPDWPGCYGQLTVPDAVDGTQLEGYDRPLESAKGWKEMIHRYAASSLGLVILLLWWQALKKRPLYRQSMPLPTFAAFFVMLQGAFGMWTVTLLVHPGIVTIHLLGGFITTSVLFWLLLNQNRLSPVLSNISKTNKLLLLTTLIVLFIQIALGGWTSTNYAALSCGNQFPTCLDTWWPQTTLGQIFYWGPIGINYEYGVLDNATRAGIQMVHRIGALTTTAAIVFTILRFYQYRELRYNLKIIALLLMMQIALGITNVLQSLPMTIAVLHNVVGLLLLLSVVSLIHKTFKRQ